MIVVLAGAIAISGRPDPDGQPAGSPTPAGSSLLPGRSVATNAPGAPATPGRSHGPDEQAFADAFLALADEHNRACTEILLANPLAEFDLVGARLTDQVIETRSRLASLPRLELTSTLVGDLDSAIADTIALLEAVDPHGPRVDQATAYQAALDHWVAHVLPVANEIRAVVGLPDATTGDLQL